MLAKNVNTLEIISFNLLTNTKLFDSRDSRQMMHARLQISSTWFKR